MRKTIISLSFIIVPVLLFAQLKSINYKIVNGDYFMLSYMELPFMANELVEIYKCDTTIIQKYFNCAFDVNANPSLRRGFACLHNMAARSLKDSLSFIKNYNNQFHIDKMISEIKYSEPLSSGIDWGLVYVGCESSSECPFSDFVVATYENAKSSMIYMTEKEIREMIKFENGDQWRYMLMGIESGDIFVSVESNNHMYREIDRRVMLFLINKWSPYQIREVQQLVSVLKEVLPTDYKDEWYEAITGRWIGKFGDKTIELTIRANEFEIHGFSKFEGQADEKRVTFYGDNDDYQQVEGPYVRFTVTEQPTDKEWNGKFNFKLIRNTDKLEGAWISNNKKLKREFVLERLDK